jgi:two-component system response regulator MtrA
MFTGIDTLPLVVCVSSDVAVRERLAGQLDGHGVVVMCPDLDTLRDMLWPASTLATAVPAVAQAEQGATAVAQAEPGAVMVDERRRRVVVRGRPVALTRIECALVGQLAGAPGQVWTYERLFTAVWGGTYLGDNAILHSAVKRLRRKLREVDGRIEIETVRGVGYRMIF